MNKTKKKFDCVQMKRELQENLYRKLAPKSSDDYFKKLIKFSEQSSFWKILTKQKIKLTCN